MYTVLRLASYYWRRFALSFLLHAALKVHGAMALTRTDQTKNGNRKQLVTAKKIGRRAARALIYQNDYRIDTGFYGSK